MMIETMASRDQWNADRTDGIFWALEYTTGDRIEWLVNRHGQMTQDIHEAMHFQSSFDADVARRGLAHPFDRAKVVQHAMIARAAKAPTMDAIEAVARALADLEIDNGEGGKYRLFELLDFSGENQTRIVIQAIAQAALSAARPFIAAECAAAIPAIMQDEWDEICNDTGCHPEDIYRASPRDRKTWYKHGHWTRAIATAIKETIR